MKKIKFIPAVLALFAMSSCTDNDLVGDVSGLKLKSNELLVTVENLGDETRAGFVEDEIEGRLTKATVFNQYDVIKIYDDKDNWRPQKWEYSEDVDAQYTNVGGVAGGDASIFHAPAGVTQYASGYGIYPCEYGSPANRFGQFTDEDRTKMKFDFDLLRVFDFNTRATTIATGDFSQATYSACPIPMWGVAADQKMTLKYLTAFLRIDIANLTAATGEGVNAKSKWLLIRSDKALRGEFTAEIAAPDDDDEGLKAQAPVLVAPDVVPANALQHPLSAYSKEGYTTNNTDILVNLGQAGGDLVIYVPIAAGKDANNKITHKFNLYLSGEVLDSNPTINFNTMAGGEDINNSQMTPIEKSVYRGQTYNVIDDDRRVNTEANTPFEVAKAIVEADKNAKRDFTLTFQNPIIVKNDDVSPQNYDIDFTGNNVEYQIAGVGAEGYALKHNVTIKAKFAKNGSATSNLTIKTKLGSKDLTIEFNSPGLGYYNLDKVTVPAAGENGLNSNLILTSPNALTKIPNITNKSVNKLTVKSACNEITSFGEFDINAPTFNVVAKVILGQEAQKLNILNGTVTAIELASALNSITEDVTIYSEGNSTIGSISYVNMPYTGTTNQTDKQVINVKSKWDGSSSNTVGKIIKRDGSEITNVVLTASQLNNYDGASEVFVLGEYDLDNKGTFGSKNLTNNFTGVAYYKYVNSAGLLSKGSATIKNLAGTNGLFSTFTPVSGGNTITNLTFDNCQINQTSLNTAGTALLVGAVDGTNNAIISNVVVNANCSVKAALKSTSVGAIVGKASGNVKFSGIDVKEASVDGYAYVGGIVGLINATSSNANVEFRQSYNGTIQSDSWYRSGDVYNKSEAVATCHSVAGISNSQNYATNGTFIGSIEEGATSVATVNIYTDNVPGKVDRNTTDHSTWLWSAMDGVDHVKYAIHNYFNEFGLCEVTAATGNVPNGVGTGITFNTKNSADSNKYTKQQTYKAAFGTTKPVDYPSTNTYYMNWVDTNPVSEE